MTCLSITFSTQQPVSLAGGVFTAPRMCNALKCAITRIPINARSSATSCFCSSMNAAKAAVLLRKVQIFFDELNGWRYKFMGFMSMDGKPRLDVP